MERFLKLYGRATLSLFSVIFLLPFNVFADATIQQKGTSSGRTSKTSWSRTRRIKGTKMRVDAVNGLGSFLLIYDLDGGKRYRLDEKKSRSLLWT